MNNASVEVLDVTAAAELLGCAPTTIEQLARTGKLPGLLFGDGGWRFPVGALARALDQLATEQAEERRKPAKPTGVLHQGPSKRARRAPPTLPALPGS